MITLDSTIHLKTKENVIDTTYFLKMYCLQYTYICSLQIFSVSLLTIFFTYIKYN